MITKVFESASSDAKHTARFDPATGEGSCSCPAWRFKRGDKERTCKHVKALAADGGASAIELPPVVTPATGQVPAPLKPMLASAMTKTTFADHANAAWGLEVKFDGHRVLIRVADGMVTAWSRPRDGAAKVRKLAPRIVAALLQMPDGLYDGEVDASLRSFTSPLVLFDICEVLGERVTAKTLRERRAMLLIAVEHVQTDRVCIMVPALEPVTYDAVEAIWASGGEGVILKRLDATYQPGKRSADWVKVKKAGSAVCELTGFKKGEMGPFSVMALRAPDGHDTTVKVLTNALRAEIAASPESFIGRRVVISYCEINKSGRYRHGIFDHFAAGGE